MRRADRLFAIVQLLRGGRSVTARRLAERLEVSERTIYRDVVELTLCGVPVAGEPGRGYTLPRSFEIPPLMFDRRELEALVVGARMVETWTGTALAAAARSALNKIRGAVPATLVSHLDDPRRIAPSFARRMHEAFDIVNDAIRDERRLHVRYRASDDTMSERTIRPLGMAYWGRLWTIGAWCELRTGYRTFRLDRIESAVVGEPNPPAPAITWEGYLAQVREEAAQRQQPQPLA